ncbi:type II secretion system F family protein [Candidatus Uhrbacteria bacterium]|nr:type II secretion system F family protein [Candidatus Uhrbacteria bacterium]
MAHDRDYFLENFAMLVASGMDVFSTLTILSDGTVSSRTKRIIATLKDDLDSGMPLWQTLKKTNSLSSHALSLIRLGEESGRLSEHLGMIVSEQKKSRIFQSKIHSAMMYPLFVLCISVIVTIGIAWFILPHLSTVFSQLKMDLPIFTRLLLGVGEFLRLYGIIAVPIFFALIGCGIYFLFFFKKTNFIGQSILFHIPAVRRILQEVELARLGSLLGSLLHAGLPIVEALCSLSESSSVGVYRKFYRHLANTVEDGSSLIEAIRSFRAHARLVPIPIQGMIAASEQSGKLAETFITIGSLYEEKSSASSQNLSALLEPILLIVIWLGVVGVALSVILPIYNLIGGFNQYGSSSPASSPAPPPEPISEQLPSIFAPPAPVQEITPTAPSTSPSYTPPTVQLKVLKTPTGFLNVRNKPSKNGGVIIKIKPGDIYAYRSKKDRWYEIILQDDTFGWIADAYAEPIPAQ